MYEPVLNIPIPSTCIDMAHDKSRNLIYFLTDLAFHVYSVPSHKIISSIPVRSQPTKIILNQVDGTIVVGYFNGDVSVYNGVSLEVTNVFPNNFSVVDLKVNKDTNTLYVLGKRETQLPQTSLKTLYVNVFDINNSYNKLFSFTHAPDDILGAGHRFVTDFYYDDDTVTTTTTRNPLAQTDLYVVCSGGSTLEKVAASTLTSSTSKSLGSSTFPQKIAINKVTNELLVTHYEADYISVHDISNLSATATNISLEEGIVDLAVHPNGQTLYYINNITDKFVIYSLSGATKVFEYDLGYLPTSLSIDFDRQLAYIANNRTQAITQIGINSNGSTIISPARHFVTFMPFCLEDRANSDTIYVGDFDNGGVYKFDKVTGDTQRLPFNSGEIFDLKYNTTTKILYVITKSGNVIAFNTITDTIVATLVNDYNGALATGDTTLPSSLAIDEIAGILYISNRIGNTISSYNLFNHTFLSIKDISDMPDGLLLDNRPTTTTTVAPVDVTLTIPDPVAPDINNYVVFYGNIGDELEYQDISPVSNTNDISEVVIFISGSVTNRITLPTEYVTNNSVFYLTVNSTQYTSSFGSGSLSSNGNYRRIDLP